MHFIHLNIRYLLPIISELRLLASKSKPAVICVTEIWLYHSVLDGELSIDGYSILRKDRCRTGGSVCLYIHSNYIFFSKLPDLNNMISWKQYFYQKTKQLQVGNLLQTAKPIWLLEFSENSFHFMRAECKT